MLVLLPPSEGKTAPEAGEAVDLRSLAFAEELGGKREEVLKALDPELRKAPTAPAAEVYTGVLFKRLELPKLPAKARRQVLIASALWGVVRPDDRIPYYKLPPKEKLDGIGPLAKFWCPALAEALPDKEGRADRRHALGRLLDDVEAEARDPAGGAGLHRGGGRAQGGLAHGKGGAGRRGTSASTGEESPRRSQGRGGSRRSGRLHRRVERGQPRRGRLNLLPTGRKYS
jgi:hypothetical protein